MTTEERFGKIEHVTAGLDEQRRKDREENRQIWRDTQRQLNEAAARINDLTLKMADANDRMDLMAEESRAADRRLAEAARAADQELRERIAASVSGMGGMMGEARAADQELRERIAALVSGMGEWMARGKAPDHQPEN
jgi:chromosome segregation ATPase